MMPASDLKKIKNSLSQSKTSSSQPVLRSFTSSSQLKTSIPVVALSLSNLQDADDPDKPTMRFPNKEAANEDSKTIDFIFKKTMNHDEGLIKYFSDRDNNDNDDDDGNNYDEDRSCSLFQIEMQKRYVEGSRSESFNELDLDSFDEDDDYENGNHLLSEQFHVASRMSTESGNNNSKRRRLHEIRLRRIHGAVEVGT